MQKFENFNSYQNEAEIFDYLINQFGFPNNFFSSYRLWYTDSQPTIFISNHTVSPNNNFNTITFGLPCMRRELPRGYPTHYFLQRFGKFASKNIITLTIEQILKLIDGERVSIPENNMSPGPKIIQTKDFIVGRGWINKTGLYLDSLKIWKQNLLPKIQS